MTRKNTAQLSNSAFAVMALAALSLSTLSSHAADLNTRDLVLLDRLTWGINASSAAHLQAVGTERWLAEQLYPASSTVLPDAVRTQIEAMPDVHKLPFDILVTFDQQAKSANQVADPDQKKAAQQVYQQAMNDRGKQAAARSILRALYAPDQLRERMTWFWFNHFNVHQYKANIRILVGDYEDRAIRPYALGTFRDLQRGGASERELRPRDHGTAHHGRRLGLRAIGRRGPGAHLDRRRD
jgi:uncharacterized protein (DUF1800 family)